MEPAKIFSSDYTGTELAQALLTNYERSTKALFLEYLEKGCSLHEIYAALSNNLAAVYSELLLRKGLEVRKEQRELASLLENSIPFTEEMDRRISFILGEIEKE